MSKLYILPCVTRKANSVPLTYLKSWLPLEQVPLPISHLSCNRCRLWKSLKKAREIRGCVLQRPTTHLPRRPPDHGPKPSTWIPDTFVNVLTFEIFSLTPFSLCSVLHFRKKQRQCRNHWQFCLWKRLYFLLCLETTPGFQNNLHCFWWGSLMTSFMSVHGLIHMPGFLTGFHMNIPTVVLQIILWEGW